MSEWRATFDQTTAVRTLIDVVHNILHRVTLRIVRTAAGDMLCVDTIDPQRVCMIQSRLKCDKLVRTSDANIEFCIDLVTLNGCLKHIPTHYSIDMYQTPDSDQIFIESYETLSNGHTTNFVLNTFIDDCPVMKLSDLMYDYTVDIDLSLLRNIIKMASSLNAQDIRLNMADDGNALTRLRIRAEGDATVEHNFMSSVETHQGTKTITASMDSAAPNASAPFRDIFEAMYPVKYINLFLKSMERQHVTMKLSPDKPLLINYPLNSNESYMRFVLAPKLE